MGFRSELTAACMYDHANGKLVEKPSDSGGLQWGILLQKIPHLRLCSHFSLKACFSTA